MSNVLSFDRIQVGVNKLRNLGIIQDTVEIHGYHITLRTLKQREHRKINQFVADYMEKYSGDEDTQIAIDATMDFFTVRKVEPLTYAIMKIDELDFTGVEYVETGEVDAKGNRIKVEKNVFLRHLVHDMDPAVIDALHRKYADLLMLAEEKAAEKIKFRDPEEELERVQQRRKELLQELGREDEIQDLQVDVDENPEEGEIQDSEKLREAVFKPLSEEEARLAIEERDTGFEPVIDPPSEENPQQQASLPQATEKEGYDFISLDDPDRPLSDDEKEYFRAQEQMYQERYGNAPQDVDEEPYDSEAEALLRKRRRQPLNQVPPQIYEGNLPSQQSPNRPSVVRRSQISTSDIPVAEGFEEREPVRLDTTRNTPKRSSGGLNKQPEGGVNPHYKGHK